MRVSVSVRLDDRNIRRLLQEFPDRAEAFVKKLAFGIERRAKQKAPVDTGFLRNSIRAIFYGQSAPGAPSIQSRFEAIIAVFAFYGIFIEFGARLRPANPFLSPAVAEESREADRALAEMFREGR